jgi:signal transduction histidine kinase
MTLRWPRSLSAQTLAVLVLILALSHAVAIGIYALDRRTAAFEIEAYDFADRVVGMVDLLQHLPPAWREDVVRESDGRTFHVTLDAAPDAPGDNLYEAMSAAVADRIRAQLPGMPADAIRVSLTALPFVPRDDAPPTDLVPDGSSRTPLFAHISVALGEAGWLNFVGDLPSAKSFWLAPTAAYIVSIAVGMGAVAIWLLSRVTAPFRVFAAAADRLGRDIRTETLPERGPTEVIQAAQAFNAMQRRVQRLVDNRTQVLAALSHDLKTPVTLIRLRTELMPESEERKKVLATLDDMQATIDAVLEFATATLLEEARRRVDMTALLGSICEDLQDAVQDVAFAPAERVHVTCQRVGMKRALGNLIDNAVKYGGAARVAIERRGALVDILIDDDGPGIPEDMMESVFMPFYRVDESRGDEKGGSGLGLSIAQAIVHGHGGQIGLENRPGGGLRVRVTLPV